MLQKSVYGLSLALLLAGCATTDDPTKGGLFGGIMGVESGAYDRRIAEREAVLGSVRIERQSAEEQQKHLASERAQKAQEKSSLDAQVAKIGKDTKRLKSQLATLKTDSDKAKQQKADLSKRLEQVNADLAKLKTGGGSDAESQKKAAQLEKEVKQLWEIYQTLQ